MLALNDQLRSDAEKGPAVRAAFGQNLLDVNNPPHVDSCTANIHDIVRRIREEWGPQQEPADSTEGALHRTPTKVLQHWKERRQPSEPALESEPVEPELSEGVPPQALEVFLGAAFAPLQAALEDLGVEAVEDLRELDVEDIEQLSAKLKKVQAKKFQRELSKLRGKGEVFGSSRSLKPEQSQRSSFFL